MKKSLLIIDKSKSKREGHKLNYLNYFLMWSQISKDVVDTSFLINSELNINELKLKNLNNIEKTNFTKEWFYSLTVKENMDIFLTWNYDFTLSEIFYLGKKLNKNKTNLYILGNYSNLERESFSLFKIKTYLSLIFYKFVNKNTYFLSWDSYIIEDLNNKLLLKNSFHYLYDYQKLGVDKEKTVIENKKDSVGFFGTLSIERGFYDFVNLAKNNKNLLFRAHGELSLNKKYFVKKWKLQKLIKKLNNLNIETEFINDEVMFLNKILENKFLFLGGKYKLPSGIAKLAYIHNIPIINNSRNSWVKDFIEDKQCGSFVTDLQLDVEKIQKSYNSSILKNENFDVLIKSLDKIFLPNA